MDVVSGPLFKRVGSVSVYARRPKSHQISESANDAPTASVLGTASRVVHGVASMIFDRFSIFSATGPNVFRVATTLTALCVPAIAVPIAVLIVSANDADLAIRAGIRIAPRLRAPVVHGTILRMIIIIRIGTPIIATISCDGVTDERTDESTANDGTGITVADAGADYTPANCTRTCGERGVIPTVVGHRRCHEKARGQRNSSGQGR
jgi:hypothetical protein